MISSLFVIRPGRSGGGINGGWTIPFTGLRGGSRRGGGPPGGEEGGDGIITPPGPSSGLTLILELTPLKSS